MKVIPLRDQIKEAERELQMRRNLYPGWVKAGKLTKDRAEYQLACQEAIVLTLTGKELDGTVAKKQAVQGTLF